MHSRTTSFLLTLLVTAICLTAFAKSPSATPIQNVQSAVEKWLDGVTGTGKVYKATLRSNDGKSPLPSRAINERLFAFQEGDLYIGIGFSKPPKVTSSLSELRPTLKHITLDRVPVPGIKAVGWQTRLQTPISSFKKGVTIESWKDGVLCVRVQTKFFAAYGRRTDILVPADAGMPQGTYFQIRKPIITNLLIEGRLFQTKVKSPTKN